MTLYKPHLLTLVILLTAAELAARHQAATPAPLPARFERFLSSTVRPGAADRRLLLSGAPMTKLLDSDPGKEVAVFGAIWIDAPRERYAAAVTDIETFESGGAFQITRKISEPPRLEDFAALRLPPEDVEDLSDCRVGDCELKLGQQTIETIRSRVDFDSPGARRAVEAILRERFLEYVTGYRAKGNAGLAVYRDGSRPTFVANELKSMIDRMPTLMSMLPQLRTYLLHYPNATLPSSTDFLYWQEARFGLKPTIRINHLVIQEMPGETVVASKMLYASHYFWTALEIRVLAPDPARGRGFWFITVNRSRSDGLSGFIGRLLRGRVRREVQEGTVAALKLTKSRMEKRPLAHFVNRDLATNSTFAGRSARRRMYHGNHCSP